MQALRGSPWSPREGQGRGSWRGGIDKELDRTWAQEPQRAAQGVLFSGAEGVKDGLPARKGQDGSQIGDLCGRGGEREHSLFRFPGDHPPASACPSLDPVGTSDGNIPRVLASPPPRGGGPAPLVVRAAEERGLEGRHLTAPTYLPSAPAPNRSHLCPAHLLGPYLQVRHSGNPGRLLGLGQGWRQGREPVRSFSWRNTCPSRVKPFCFSNLISQGDNSPPQGI